MHRRDAMVLFDGDGGSTPGRAVTAARRSGTWLTQAMEVEPRTGTSLPASRSAVANCTSSGARPRDLRRQPGRGNSGVFLLGLYEIQVLDGYDNPTYADGLTAAIYGQHPPLVNACVPPGQWHVYDIVFESPVYRTVTWRRRRS